jgi:hypothetical protein
MSNFRPLSGQATPRVPTPPRGETIARYDTYLEAQRAVDFLSDQQFPVQFVTIVGTGLRMVERVTGRLTYPRVAGASALSGLYFGFFVGLALTLFGGGNDLSIFAVALVGAGFGMLFGIISYALTGGRRDFTSTSQIVASEYEVLCLAEQAGAARDMLRRLPGGHGRQVTSERGPGGVGPGAGGPGGGPGSGGAAGGPAGGARYPGPGGYPGTGGYPQPGPNPYAPPGQAPGVQHPTGQYPPPPGAASPYGPPPGAPQAGVPGAAEPEPTQVIGPTYGEMIERQRQEQRAREAAEREAAERVAAEREAAEKQAEQAAAEHAAAERAARDRALQEPGSGSGSPDEPRA